jgi:6,7-dimethyl-8-ribityllumazine synthase
MSASVFQELQGDKQGASLRIGIAVARFNAEVTEALLHGALSALARCGVSPNHITVARVPGAFELPGVAQHLAKNHDAVICLGAVIQGGTPHFEYVCQAATDGILRVGLDVGKPVIFGVLTCGDARQALERAGLVEPEGGWNATADHVSAGTSSDPIGRNKGAEAALAAVEMARLYRSF